MKTTHTHRGHCQACGAIQAVDNNTGLLAKHGYKVAGFGYFAGVCHGAAHKPLEVERAFTDFIISEMVRITAEQRARADALRAGTVKPLRVVTDKRDDSNPKVPYWMRLKIEVAFADATPYQQGRQIERDACTADRNADHHESHGKMLTGLAKRVHGAALKAANTKPAPVDIYPGLKFKAANGTVWEVKSKQWGTRWAGKYVSGANAGNVGKVFNLTANEIRAAVRAGGKL